MKKHREKIPSYMTDVESWINYIVSQRRYIEDNLIVYCETEIQFKERKKAFLRNKYNYTFDYGSSITKEKIERLRLYEKTISVIQNRYGIVFIRKEESTADYRWGHLTISYEATINRDDIDRIIRIDKKESEEKCNARLQKLLDNKQYSYEAEKLMHIQPFEKVEELFWERLRYNTYKKFGITICLRESGIGVGTDLINAEHPDRIVYFSDYGYKKLNSKNEEMEIMLLTVYKVISNSLNKFIQLSPSSEFYNAKITIPENGYSVLVSFSVKVQDDKELTSLFSR